MKSPFEDVRAIFFDVDDTLYDFHQSMRHAFEHLHITFPDVLGDHAVDAISDAYWTHYEQVPRERKVHLIHNDPDRFRTAMWTGALAGLGIEQDHAPLARRITDEMQRVRPEHWRRAMYPGATDLLAELRERLPIGVITNGPSKVQRPKIEALRYRDYFSERRVFVSGEFGVNKPDPSIFLAAAKTADVDPQHCLMIGDAREFDMPAKAVGFKTILFTGPREVPDVSKDEHAPDAVVADYAGLRRWLV